MCNLFPNKKCIYYHLLYCSVNVNFIILNKNLKTTKYSLK